MSTESGQPPAGRWNAQALRAQMDRLLSKRRTPATVQLFRDAAAEAQRSRLPQMAAALSYRTIFGLIPVMVVALIALKFFTTDADITDALNKAMQYSGLSSIAVSEQESGMGPFPESSDAISGKELSPGAQAAGAIHQSVIEAGPDGGHADASGPARLDLWIRELVARVSGINFKAIGLIGLIALIYAAISMLVEVERAFNQVYRVPVGRSWVRRITHYWTLLTLGTIGLFLTFYVGQRFTTEVVNVAAWAGAESGSTVLLAIIGYLSTATISTLLFLLVYTVVPNTRVKFGPALVGAALAALAWEAGKWGFTQYLRFSTGYAKLYGSIALIPLFLLWVYVTWCIVLFGLNVAYYLQHGRTQTRARPVEAINPGVVDPAIVITLVALLSKRVAQGESANAATLAGELGVQEGIVSQMLDKLVAAGIVNRVVKEDHEGFFALAKPPDRISAEEALRVGEELITQPPDSAGPIAAALRKARLDMVRGRTLASMLEAPGAEPSAFRPAPPVARPAAG
jgi:membrane protein